VEKGGSDPAFNASRDQCDEIDGQCDHGSI
jgi:hypothetical protein